MKDIRSYFRQFRCIVDKAAVVTVCLADDGKTGESIDRSAIKPDDRSQGIIVCITEGYGLMVRETTSAKDIVAKVTNETGENGCHRFVWTFSDDGNCIAFARRDKIDPILEKLDDVKDRIIAIECIPGRLGGISVTAKKRVAEKLSLKMLAPNASDFSSNLAMLLFRKQMLPVLTSILLLVGLNAVVSRYAVERLAVQEARMAVMERETGRQENIRRSRMTALLRYTTGIIPGSSAALCDRIGSAVPQDVVLTQLSLQKAKKSFSSGKYPEISSGIVEMEGTSPSYATVKEFMKELEKHGNDISLTGMDTDKEGKCFRFRITMGL